MASSDSDRVALLPGIEEALDALLSKSRTCLGPGLYRTGYRDAESDMIAAIRKRIEEIRYRHDARGS